MLKKTFKVDCAKSIVFGRIKSDILICGKMYSDYNTYSIVFGTANIFSPNTVFCIRYTGIRFLHSEYVFGNSEYGNIITVTFITRIKNCEYRYIILFLYLWGLIFARSKKLHFARIYIREWAYFANFGGIMFANLD